MTAADTKQHDHFVSEMRKEEQKRQSGYRERALKLFPHVCGRCTREFEGKKLRELTVHHRERKQKCFANSACRPRPKSACPTK